MSRARRVPFWLLAGLLWLAGPHALALNPALDASQYAHTAWRIRDGFTKGTIHAIAQTPDGFLWLGTDFGLLRFDGVRITPWQPAPGEALPDGHIRNLLVARDGALWIGTNRGLASLSHGALVTHPQFDRLAVNGLAQDRQGTVWASAASGVGEAQLCAIRTGGTECYGRDGRFGTSTDAIAEDRDGNLWLEASNGVWRWQPGPPRLFSLPDARITLHSLSALSTGGLLVLTSKGADKIVEGNVKEYWIEPASTELPPRAVLSDRDGAVWIGTSGGGLFHLHDGRTDEFGSSDGLSGDDVSTLFEDREQNIWVSTNEGLDRFRALPATTYSAQQGVMGESSSVLADRDGSVWLSTRAGVYRWQQGHFVVYRAHPETSSRGTQRSIASHPLQEVSIGGLPENTAGALFQDHTRRVWLGTRSTLGYLEQMRLVPIVGVPGGYIDSIAEDRDGNLWVAHRDAGLLELSSDRVVQQIPWTKFGESGPAWRIAVDPVQGGLWLGFFSGGVVHVVDGQVRASYGSRDGLGQGSVKELRIAPDGTPWAATESGLSRLKAGHVATLSTKDGLPCNSVEWSIEDEGSLWISTACGLARIAQSDLQSWTANVDQTPARRSNVRVTVLDNSDGVRGYSNTTAPAPHVAKTADGKLWFITPAGLTMVDPHHSPVNTLPPTIQVQWVIADRTPFDASKPLHLPPRVRDLQIDYTALTLVAPEKVQFRYMLEGRDREWQQAGNRRSAFYTDLPPGPYRFRVIASNNSGVWNAKGAELDFSVAPAYWQSDWFRALCLLGAVLGVWALVWLRIRQVTARVRGQLEERMAERERIARDLHDTLLQSVQGLLLRFQVAADRIPQGDPAREVMDRALERADEVLDEGRARVKGLRAAVGSVPRLPQAVARIIEELAPGDTSRFRITVEGTVRELDPIVREEAKSIAREALANAYRHADATNIEAEITYTDEGLTVRVRDDGQGIEDTVVREGRPGHFGLLGMRERARKINARLRLWSKPGAGTEVEIRVPASIAYRKSARRPRRKLRWRKAAMTDTEDAG